MAARLLLDLPREFDYHLNLEFLKRSPRELLHKIDHDSVLKVVKHGDEKMLICIRASDKKLIVEFINGTPTAIGKAFVKNFVKEWFDLETNLSEFYKLVSSDRLLQPLVKRFYGYRIIGQPDLFESIIWAVIGQQINLPFAYTLKSRFVEQFGERLHWNNQSYYLFPTPQVVAGLTDAHLLPLQFSRQKSKYTTLIAEAFANNVLSKESLRKLSFEEAKNELMKIKGIGNWTANYALMKTFRYPNAFPLEDAGVHNAIKNLKKMDRKPTLDEVKRVFKKYRGWEAYATLYFWKSL